MLRKILVASCLLATSMATQASLISHYGYERDSSSNIVKGGGLEWLKWDVTKGMSINSALVAYAGQGYRVASNNEVTALFQAFQFGKTDWTATEPLQVKVSYWGPGEDSAHNAFISLFGSTRRESCSSIDEWRCYSASDPFVFTGALYRVNEVGGTGLAYVYDDSRYIWRYYNDDLMDHYAARVYVTGWTNDTKDAWYGVALVRNSVPTPASIGLLALGLVASGLRRRKA